MRFRTPRFATMAAGVALIGAHAFAAPPAIAAVSSTVITDQAIRDWLATHPEALDKIVLDALSRQAASPVIDKLVHDSYLRQPGLVQEGAAAVQVKLQADRAAQFQKLLPAAHGALYNDAKDGRDGAANPAATVVIFFDYECPFCKAIQPALARLLQEHADVEVIYKEFPILGPVSLFAAKASLAAAQQGKYPAFHAALMAAKIPEHQLKEEQVLDMAQGAGLDIDRLKSDLAAPAIEAKIAANKALAASLAIQGTPGIIIGNQVVPGNVPYEQLLTLVEAAKRGVVAPPS